MVGTRPESRRVVCTTKAAISGWWWGEQAQLYKYNGNLLHLCAFASLELSLAKEISAGEKFLSACGKEKSASGNRSVSGLMESCSDEKKESVTIFALRARFSSLV